MFSIFENITNKRVSEESYATPEEANHDYHMNEGHTHIGQTEVAANAISEWSQTFSGGVTHLNHIALRIGRGPHRQVSIDAISPKVFRVYALDGGFTPIFEQYHASLDGAKDAGRKFAEQSGWFN